MATMQEEEPNLRFMMHSTLAVPYDQATQFAYSTYKTSLQTKKLLSERGQVMRADAFIQPQGLGPLWMLCVRVLGESATQENMLDIVRDHPDIMRYYKDRLSVDLPLEKCYTINDENYWRRVVIAKTGDKSIIHTNTKFKNWGITLKLTEYLESHPAEFYHEEEIHALASKIRYFVKDLHLAHLKAITEKTFLDKLRAKMASDSESTTTSSRELSSISSSTELSKESESIDELDMEDYEKGEVEEEGEEEGEVEEEGKEEGEVEEKGKEEGEAEDNERKGEGAKKKEREQARLRHRANKDAMYLKKATMKILEKNLSVEETSLRLEEAVKKVATRQQLRSLRKEKLERRRRREEKKLLKEAEKLRLEQENILAEKKRKLALRRKKRLENKKKKKNAPEEHKSIFLFEVEPPEESIFADVLDERNKEEYSKFQKELRHTDMSEVCTHYNLRFVRFFSLLESFSLEFAGPKERTEYIEKDYLFSTKDMERLAYGISFLHHLKNFRLRNSKMTAAKLLILTTALKELQAIETVDFHCTFLEDDCADAIYELFQKTPTIKSLELGYNSLSTNTLQRLADALNHYGGCLEYLGLDGNPLGDNGLHILNAVIVPSNHIQELNLRCISLPQSVISCCIAQELVMSHAALQRLNLSMTKIDANAAAALINALKSNQKITQLDVRDCGLALEDELDINILIKRNKYIAENMYEGNTKLLKIEDLAGQIKNPILLRARENVIKRAQCLANRPPEEKLCSHLLERTLESDLASPRGSEYTPYDDSTTNTDRYRETLNEELVPTDEIPLAFDANNFDETDIMRCITFGDRTFYKYLRDRRSSAKYDVPIA